VSDVLAFRPADMFTTEGGDTFLAILSLRALSTGFSFSGLPGGFLISLAYD
jgi:hypothetical protein